MEGGDLGRRLCKDKAVPRQTGWYQQGRFIALGIARGLLYLHSRGVVWFDCKPGNLLLNGSGNVAMIADFGLARILENTYIITHQVSKCCTAFALMLQLEGALLVVSKVGACTCSLRSDLNWQGECNAGT